MMNKELEEELFVILILRYFIARYILISWILALLLFCYEFLIGPMFNVLFLENNSVYLNLNLSKNLVNTLFNQLVPIPIDQFIETELTLIVPSTIIFGILYFAAKKENHDE